MKHSSKSKQQAVLSERQRRIFEFLNSHPTGVLASVDPNGEPHAAVIYHAIDKNGFIISFLTKRETKKYDNLVRNNHVVLIVFDQHEQTVANVTGTVASITDHDAINNIASAVCAASLQTSKSGAIPIAKLDAGEYAAFRIVPKQIRIAYYARSEPDDYRQLFESIESFDLHLEP